MSKKILVCDDNEEILEVIQIILAEDGEYEVKTISDSEKIIELIKDFKPDLLLLDVWIENQDGREVTKKIREIDGLKSLPILFISALNELNNIAKDADVQGYIKKPFTLEELLEKVESTLNECT